MATLVLTAVGGAIGGPIGAMAGALIGGAADREIFRPGRRHGPRLSDLRVQTSAYGQPVPQVFGTMRIAGQVIWATDLAEHREEARRGKGQPATTLYSYTASLAVALSSRLILAVGRIWADGNLVRGGAGDWKVATGFRLHTGDEDQSADPLIVQHEGEAAPAHRGIAYAVFEDLALADFGNRIPSLTFEVIADAGAVGAGAIAAAIGAGVLSADGAGAPVVGFAAQGDDARDAIGLCAEIAGARIVPAEDGLRFVTVATPARTVADAGFGPEGATGRRELRAAETVPRTIDVAHYDPARDHQTGSQRATRPGAGRRHERIELPAALHPADAAAIAAATMARAEAARTRRTVWLDSAAIDIAPGAIVAIAGEAGRWRVTAAAIEAMAVRLELCPELPGAGIGTGVADGGRAATAPDRMIGRTLLIAAELPPADETAGGPRLTMLAAGEGEGWRSAALSWSLDAGASWTAAGASAAPAVIGQLIAPLAAGVATLRDRRGTIEIALAHAAMGLAGADARTIDAGGNLALIGDELVQFAEAVQIAPRQWRLATLLRGRRGSVAAAHPAGTRFALLEPSAARFATLPPAAIGGIVRVMARGVGDGTGAAIAEAMLSGRSVAPPAPVHLRLGGDGVLRWTRRSRIGWTWRDGADAPLGEEREAYRVVVTLPSGAVRTIETAVPALALAAADRIGGTILAVRQIGTLADSAETRLTLAG